MDVSSRRLITISVAVNPQLGSPFNGPLNQSHNQALETIEPPLRPEYRTDASSLAQSTVILATPALAAE